MREKKMERNMRNRFPLLLVGVGLIKNTQTQTLVVLTDTFKLNLYAFSYSFLCNNNVFVFNQTSFHHFHLERNNDDTRRSFE